MIASAFAPNRCCSVRALLFAALLCVSAAAQAQIPAGPAGTEFSVLSYNIHGLFRWIAADDPRDRMPTIGWLANRYDVVGFQEDFEYHDIVKDQIQDSVGWRGNGMGWDPRRVGAKLLLAPFAIFIPHFSPPYGSGLATFVRRAYAIPDDCDRVPYGVCFEWIGQNGDCWARKGYLRVTMRTPEGAVIDVYNTHLEAGPESQSIETRRLQLEVLAEGIERMSAQRAVIVLGDFNSAFARPGDRENIMSFRRRLGLLETGAGPELPIWRERDFILYRSGALGILSVEAAGEAKEFVSGGRALSDHPGLTARFRATPGPQSAEPAP
jgi:endonuclease/exonuclease/phosphatase family metal-dependent hydrolase